MIFVRHGQSAYLEQHHDKDVVFDLTPKGVKEAKALATTLSHIRNPIILTSPRARSVSHAQVMQEQMGGVVVTNPLLNDFVGNDPAAYLNFLRQQTSVVNEFVAHLRNGSPDILQNSHEFFSRRDTFLAMAGELTTGNLIVVTHGEVLKSWFGDCVLRGEIYER